MKVERKESFTPVVITLETEEEVKALITGLGTTTVDGLMDEYSLTREKAGELDKILYAIFDAVTKTVENNDE